MRKFIVSDIHGLGNIYYSIVGYLENVSKEDEVTLYINGDLFDRGPDSGEVLLDVLKRMKDGPFKIEYLGGNHELLMYDLFDRRIRGLFRNEATIDWYRNGGRVTDDYLSEKLSKEAIIETVNVIGNLDIYHKFEETIGDKPIVLVHALCPSRVKDKCDLKVRDRDIDAYVWTRENDLFIPFRCRIGWVDYFSIVGHTENNNPLGFEYCERVDGNYLNIDGGCRSYALGDFSQDHVPLVEVFNERLKVLTFNNSNNIIAGNYFSIGGITPMTEAELATDRSLLNKGFKPKRLVKLPNNTIGYEGE